MTQRSIWWALLASVLVPALAHAQAGDAALGKTFWAGPTVLCRNCHGTEGEGGFGPDLAGRGLTAAQFAKAVHEPWGVMPAFTEQQVSAANIANLVAYFNGLPKPAAPAAWRVPLTPSMPPGQQLAVSHGCAQCHGAELNIMRQDLGAVAADYNFFTRLVYTHTASMPELEMMLGNEAPIRMGNFNGLRTPEPVLQEIWKYLTTDLGFRARMQARVAPGTTAADGTTFTVSVLNGGLQGKGLAVEDVSLNLVLPAGASVVKTTGAGYQGTRKDDKGADVASWRVPRMATRDMQTFSITLGGAAQTIASGTVTWARPGQKNGAASDTINVALPPRPAAQ